MSGMGIVGGKLKLKGVDKKKKKKKKSNGGIIDGNQLLAQEQQVSVTTLVGSGQLLTSGTSVMGKGTKFNEETAAGDAITITNESTLVEETRRITMVLGPTSISLNAPFNSDIITYADYTITRVPRGTSEKDAAKLTRSKSSKSELVWREVSGMGYKIHKKKVKGAGALDLLDMRCKKKADRLCM